MPYRVKMRMYTLYSKEEKLESKQKRARSRTVQQAEYTVLREGRRGARDAVCRSMIYYCNVPNIDELQINSFLPTSSKHSNAFKFSTVQLL
jgi:hypothetical protein